MELSAQIKKYRTALNLSQDELAEKIYVSRQTVSNWENDKNYPDIHSLLLLSSVFHVTLDTLIKGDMEVIKEEVKESEIRRLNRYGAIYGALLLSTVLSLVPLVHWLGLYGFIPWSVLFGVTLFAALKTERIKKDNDICTYKEILAFTEGNRLDETERQQEFGKRMYQKILLAFGSGCIAFFVCFLLACLFSRV